MTTTKPFDLLTVPQAAAHAGLQPDTIRDLIHRGLLAAQRPGREWLIRPRDLDRYLRCRRPVGRPPKKIRKKSVEGA